jgi:rod shape-determining protein MreD
VLDHGNLQPAQGHASVVTLYLVIPLLAIAAILQTAILPHMTIWGVFPDLPALIVVSWSLQRGAREGMLWGFVAGVAVDLFSGAPFGAATLGLMVIALLAGLGQATVYRARFVLSMVAMFLATILYDLVFLLVMQISGQTVAWLDSVRRVVLPSAALNAALMPVVYAIMRALHTRFGREEMEW